MGIQEVNFGSSTGINSFGSGDEVFSYSPVDGKLIARVKSTTKQDYKKIIGVAKSAFKEWRLVPAPQRGEVVRQYGEKLRAHKKSLGILVSYETGKSLQESELIESSIHV